jgi:hypothetical protein
VLALLASLLAIVYPAVLQRRQAAAPPAPGADARIN